jgi:outer membrane protein TolC
MRICRCLVFNLVGVLTAAAFSARAETNTLQLTVATLRALAEEVRTNNAAVRAAEERADAAQAHAAAVPTWADPTVRIGVMGADRMMRRDDGDLLYGIEQTLPFWGKPQAARRLAQAEAATAGAIVTLRTRQYQRDAIRAAFQIALADRTVRLDREDLHWLETFLASTQRRYESGTATQAEVLRLQNERSRRANQLATDMAWRDQARADLNRLLNRPLESPWPEFLLPPIASAVTFNGSLVESALQAAPELQVRREAIREAEAAVDVARRARYPDLSAGAEVRQYHGNGDFRQSMVMLGLRLPWGNRQRYAAAIQRDEARLRATQLDANDYEQELRREVRELTVRLDAARREAELYRDQIIPRSEAALASARAAWESGRGQFRDVFEARQMLVAAELAQARATVEQYTQLTDLMFRGGFEDFAAFNPFVPESETSIQPAQTTNP